MDTAELIRRAERELGDGNRSAKKTVERVRRELLKQRDADGLEQLLGLAGRLDDGGDLTYAIRQNLQWLSRQPQGKRERRVIALLGVLLVHGFGALTWLAAWGWVEQSEQQFNRLVATGAATWSVAALLIAWQWRSGRSTMWIPFASWFASSLLMVVVLSLYDADDRVGSRADVYATATFDESADCLHYWRYSEGWRLNGSTVADCFPTQTAAKRKALIACFNKYERNHPDHEGWPEDNMRGCAWDGLVAVPAQNVASLVFGKVEALPAAPRAGEHFILMVGVTRSDSAAKVVHTPLDALYPDAAVTINGESLAIKSVAVPCASCADGCTCSDVTEPEAWFFDGKIRVKFTVPKTAEGKRLAIKLSAEQGDTPTATKVVTFTVGP